MTGINRLQLIAMPLVLALMVGQAFADKPNIVLILADYMGYGDCGAYNPESKISTPHIDQLAKEGLLFTDAHAAASTCTPSRYGLLTGINPVRTGVLNTLLSKGNPIIAEDEKTLPSMLKDQGYITRMIGKWHLGFKMDTSARRPAFDFSKPLTGGPLDRGFDSWFGMHSSPGAQPLCYFDGRRVVEEPTSTLNFEMRRGGKTISVKANASPGFSLEETSPLFCRKAVEIIRDHAATQQRKPLFLYYASPIPHEPWGPRKQFQGKSKVGNYGDFVMQLDDVVGQIDSALKDTGLDRNTLLIFTSDNGPGPDAWKVMSEHGHASSGVLRGKKAESYEGGHRVPFIARWPGRISAGGVTSATINFTDLFATLVQMLEVELANDQPGDSFSFFSVLLDPSTKHRRPAAIHGRHAVRDGDWKLVSSVRREDAAKIKLSSFGLYHLAEDISEQNNLAQSNPEAANRLYGEFKRFIRNRKLKQAQDD